MNIQPNNSIININNIVHVIHPQSLIRSLVVAINSPCNCGTAQSRIKQMNLDIDSQIRGIQEQISNIRAQVLEVERLLSVRDSLFKEMDLLREERQKIEFEIQSLSRVQNTENIKYLGYREMSQRLRRRIREVREFVQKMIYENHKIQGGINSNNQFFMHQEEQLYLRRRQQQLNQGIRLNMTSFQSMISKLHGRQQQAWRRIRRQQQDIQRHNLQARSRNGNNFTYYSPKARTYYSPT